MISILERISPFSLLSSQERNDLFQNSEMVEFQPNQVICCCTQKDYDWLYILLEGKASVCINKKLKGHIEAPSYFGELSVFFDQPRSTTIIAKNKVVCLVVAGNYVRNLLHKNLSFQYEFASILKNKQRLFYDYTIFLANLIEKKRKKTFSVRELIPLYKNLNPILHPGSTQVEIDFPALDYVIRKLHFNVTSVNSIFLTEDFPAMYSEISKKLFKKRGSVKKHSYEILPGKILILLRDEISDFIDIMTKLCLYLIESKKIYSRIIHSESAVAALSKYYFNKKTIESSEMSQSLPFTDIEMRYLKKIFGRNIYKRIYEIVAQQGDITIQMESTSVRYYAISSETWLNEIRKVLVGKFGKNILDSRVDVHIISSNTHSVRNCLSAWIHDHRQEILSWGEKNTKKLSKISDQENSIYAIVNSYFKKHPEKIKERDRYDTNYGIYHIHDTSLTGIDVTLIDVPKLGNKIDPKLGKIISKNKLIVNINYAYGRQAKIILHSLMLLFNKKITSISIFGKAGGVIGNRGDIVLPGNILLQENEFQFPIYNCDITSIDFQKLGWQKNILSGGLLTVQGTLTQTRILLKYFQLFWNIAAMEMESSYYIQEISSAMNYGILDKNIITRFIYYLSDLPLTAHENLTVRMKLEEGLDTVYTITRCVLQKILS